jgi:hypothetical protein
MHFDGVSMSLLKSLIEKKIVGCVCSSVLTDYVPESPRAPVSRIWWKRNSSWQTYDRGEPAVSCRWMNRLSLRNNRLNFEVHQDCTKITDHFRGIYRRIYPNLMKQNRRMSTCNRLDLQTLSNLNRCLCPKISRITARNTDKKDMAR